jgi:hypothetical protein
MKTTFPTEVPPDKVLPDSLVEELMADDIPAEYEIDYSKAKPNRFAGREAATKTVKLDADVAAVFKSEEAVNTILRALIQAMPQAIQHQGT